MLAIISPAKSMDFSPVKVAGTTKPEFEKEAFELVKTLREYSPTALKKLFSVSDSLATLNHDRFQSFVKSHTLKNAKPALYAYTGDVYKGIHVEEYSAAQRTFANKHVRILTGLYGVLRPLDLIQPYRLEMGTKLKNAAGKDLYAFWTDAVTASLVADLKKNKSSHLVNLASQEYAKVVEIAQLPVPVLNISFKEKKAGAYKIIALFAKQARGLMVDFVVRERVLHVADLKEFAVDGYKYSAKLSSESELVFVRG